MAAATALFQEQMMMPIPSPQRPARSAGAPRQRRLLRTLLCCSATAWLAAPAWAQQAGPCTQGLVDQGWASQAFPAQKGRFTSTVDITPVASDRPQLLGLSQGAKLRAEDFAALLRFGADGQVQARNGATFTTLRRLRYHADVTYRVRFDVDLAARTYSVWLQRQNTERARPFVQVAKDFALGAPVAQLDTLGLQQAQGGQAVDAGTAEPLQACALAVTPPAARPPNPDCTLLVPADPLSPAGLATPYQLVATDPAQGECRQANADQAAFVQAVILDPATGQLSVYSPLVIDKGTQPAVAPVLPVLPANAVVGLWFGYNGDNLTLRSANAGRVRWNGGGRGGADALAAGRCVNGLNGSVFGQFAHCNAPAFFTAAQSAIRAGLLQVPPLGTGVDGLACPSARSFWVSDQDPSDNVPTEYLEINGRFAQSTALTRAAYPTARKVVNPSDERLVSVVLDPVLKCQPFTAPDLADPGQQVTALALNELQAAVHQTTDAALIPPQDPMVLVDGERSLAKLNAYRAGVGQPPASSISDRSAAAFCARFREQAPARFIADRTWFVAAKSPAPADASNLFTFLSNRYVSAYGLLDCRALLGQRVNMRLTRDAGGVVVDARLR